MKYDNEEMEEEESEGASQKKMRTYQSIDLIKQEKVGNKDQERGEKQHERSVPGIKISYVEENAVG